MHQPPYPLQLLLPDSIFTQILDTFRNKLAHYCLRKRKFRHFFIFKMKLSFNHNICNKWINKHDFWKAKVTETAMLWDLTVQNHDITTSVSLKCGLEQQKDHLPKRRKRLGTSSLFSLNINIIFIKTIVKLTYHLIFQRKHELNAANLTSAQSFPPFGEVVLLLLKSTLQRQWSCNECKGTWHRGWF